jgi:hypothetical protein
LRWPRDTLYPQKLALTTSTSFGRSVGIGRSRTEATEFSLVFSYEQETSSKLGWTLFATCFLRVAFLDFSSTVKMEAVMFFRNVGELAPEYNASRPLKR